MKYSAYICILYINVNPFTNGAFGDVSAWHAAEYMHSGSHAHYTCVSHAEFPAVEKKSYFSFAISMLHILLECFRSIL